MLDSSDYEFHYPPPQGEARENDRLEELPQQEQFYRAPARFGNIPVDAEPKGWDRRRGFRKLYPRIDLPTQIVERVSLGNSEPHEPNRLIWGDNLHVMRQIPSNSIDLVYIDPPFFSGRQYNELWGDNNELRSFNDIWESGLDGYLIWLNARLYEMKRILKPTGSIYVHCDKHASHYIKVEMDKIFGYDNFKNEIIWCYRGMPSKASRFQQKHDNILFYVKDHNNANRVFNTLTTDPDPGSLKTYESARRVGYNANHKRMMVTVFDWDKYHKAVREGKIPAGMREKEFTGGRPPMRDWWDDIKILGGPSNKERIGYPTQKPEELLERIVKASSKEGDIILDCFVGGGTTAAVAQRLGRNFIACDQSRVAIAVTAERLKHESMSLALDNPRPDFTVEQWGNYEANRLSHMPIIDFQDFVLSAYGTTGIEDLSGIIHGWRHQLPIWVGSPGLDSQTTAEDVYAFANAIRQTEQYQQANLRNGEMLAWGFRPDAAEAADRLSRLEDIDGNFLHLAQIRIGDDEFRRHVVKRSTDLADYSDFLTFIQPPVVDVGYKALGGRRVTFDAGDTAVVNPGAELINIQWDFDYDGETFAATPGYSLQQDKKTKKPLLRATHEFDRTGTFRVACRVQDSKGGEGMWDGEVEVS